MLDRRSLIGALGATVLAGLARPGSAPAGEGRVFAGCRMGADGRALLALFDLDGRELLTTDLPSRGHDCAVSPDGATIVAFARRPGTWAAVVDRATGRVRHGILAAPGRHFYGHGVFLDGGRLLAATENGFDEAGGEGRLGLYDAGDGYRRVGEIASAGVGPHDVARLADRRLAVANGGIRTHPDTGRDILNRDAMRPNLAILDQAGTVIDRLDLDGDLHTASLRHLDVAPDGTVVFGCQWEGAPEEGPPLVGLRPRGGGLEWLPMPDDALVRLDNYVGSVAVDASGTIVSATSPRGNTAAFWDLPGRRFLGTARIPDVCGVAAVPDPPPGQDRAGLFVLSSGNAGVRLARAGRTDVAPLGGSALDRWAWDNHLTHL